MLEILIYPNIQEIAEPYPAILLDAYGVFWKGNKAGLIPGAAEQMAALVSKGKTVGILSNSMQFSSNEQEKWHKHGLIEGRHFHFSITSGDITHHTFKQDKLLFPTPRKKFWPLFGGPSQHNFYRHLFQDTLFEEVEHLNEADFIYISVPQLNGEDHTDPKLFHKHVEPLMKSSLPMLCGNPDLFAHEGYPPRPVVRQGSIAKIYEELGGKVFYIGKPHPQAFSHALDKLKEWKLFQPHEILMVGDTPETDIRGAKQCGLASALVMQTGILAERITHNGWNETVRSLQPSDYPDFFIQQLG